jgi:hypothetical protein
VHRLAHGRVVHPQVVGDGPDHDLPGVEADPDLHRDAVPAQRLLGIAADAILHRQGGVAGADGVVLVGQRRPEQGHDAVAHHLVDGTFVLVDGRHHTVEHGIEQVPRLLWVALGQQLHGPLEVGKQHRDLLALAFQGGAGGEDLLG